MQALQWRLTKKQRIWNSSDLFTESVLCIRRDAASIWTQHSLPAAQMCCWGSCWPSDSDQYACYQNQGINGTAICPGRTIFSQQLFRSQLPLYWLMKILAVKLSKGRWPSLMYLEKKTDWLQYCCWEREKERGEKNMTEKMKPLPWNKCLLTGT